MQTKLDKHRITGDIMGFLNKIKESVGMNSKNGIDVPALDKDLDLLNSQQAAQENTVQPEMETQEAPAADIPSNTENIPSNTDVPPNAKNITSNDIEGIPPSSEPIQEPSLPPETQPEIKDAENEKGSENIADIQTPEESTKDQDTQDNAQDTVPENTPLENNTAGNFENIKQEKMKISGELERLTTEIDGIIKNLENELKDGKTINKTETKPENNTKEDKKASDVSKKEKEIKKAADNKADNAAPAKQSEESKKITEKDIEALEDFLSKENIKDMPKSK